MKIKHNHLAASGLAVLILTGLVACGEVEDVERSYSVTLTEVNPQVAPGVLGNGDLVLTGDNFTATLDLTGAPGGVHRQGITVGAACPTIKDDANADGYVDGVEAQVSSGKTLIPLDGDLTSQAAGENEYPSDNYNYSESTPFSTMLADLVAPDTNPNDSVVKLSAAEELTLQGKVVVVWGVAPDTVVPATVAGVDQLTPQQSLPIACGVIERVNGETGSTTGGTTTGGETGTTTGTTTGETGTTGGETGTTTGETGTTGGETGTTTGETGTTTGETGTTGGETGTTTGGTTGLI